MKNKGFTLIEVLAVIVILGVISTIAMISITRYRKEADDKDLANLYSAVQTSYDNYRLNVLSNGEEPENSFVIKDGKVYKEDGTTEISNSNILMFFNDLAYSGNPLKSDEIEVTIKNRVKGDLLNKEAYKEEINEKINKKYTQEQLNEINNKITSLTTAINDPTKKDAKYDNIQARNAEYLKLDQFYVKDITCKVTSDIVSEETEIEVEKEGSEEKEVETATIKEIKKRCERNNEDVIDSRKGSNSELLCIKVKNRGGTLIDDYTDGSRFNHNRLCQNKYWSE